MHAGIIAAGRGERLRRSAALKPLVRVGDLTLIEHVLTSIAETAVTDVAIIINDASLAVREHVTASRWPFQLHWIVETTPSSMHSFLRNVETLAERDREGQYLISTVDTVAPPGAYAAFAAAAGSLPADVVLALTPPDEDDNPLLVRLDGSRVVALGSQAAPPQHATAGYYAVRSSVLREADHARRDGLGALREFLERLLARGYALAGIPVPASFDVDRPTDVEAAERFVRRVSV
jgi:NDP-sugar pyrophosphorylase family protein